MQPQRHVIPVKAAFVSDRGLSQKRPLNEDSFLCDPNRCLFIVADGVGGAQAGEVASQTAVEVLDEAFRHQLSVNDDVEDLMELAIQRANNSIYQMAREHPKFSAMATTVVVLHINGLNATIGHAGDSRLYRLSPDGRLYQETFDHSVVEEEVRAGRMTREQAANHPSRNVISRALGAEANVEVEMKSTRFEDGTTFLLCSDGITRHISDTEIRTLLGSRRRSLEKICEEMKTLCYDRGAEDNLTAVVVRVGGFDQTDDEERTVPSARPMRTDADDYRVGQMRPPVATVAQVRAPSADLPAPVSAPLEEKKRGSGFFKKLLMFLLFIGSIAGAFYGGMVLRDKFQEKSKAWGVPVPLVGQPTPAPQVEAPTGPTAAKQRRDDFLKECAEIDKGADIWLKQNSADRAASGTAADMYLLGRAHLRNKENPQAIEKFDTALTKIDAPESQNSPVTKVEIQVARLAAQGSVTPDDLSRTLDGMGKKSVAPETGPSSENPKPDNSPSPSPSGAAKASPSAAPKKPGPQ